jgi:hypothetical protein
MFPEVLPSGTKVIRFRDAGVDSREIEMEE